VQDLVTNKLQKTMSQILKKVCPLRNSDIRVMEAVGEIKASKADDESSEAESEEQENETEMAAEAEKKPRKKTETSSAKPAKKRVKKADAENKEPVAESEDSTEKAE